MKTFFLDLLQLYLMWKLVVWSVKLLLHRKNYGKNRKSRSIGNKVISYAANGIHYRLDSALYKQKGLIAEKLKVQESENVVPFKRKRKA